MVVYEYMKKDYSKLSKEEREHEEYADAIVKELVENLNRNVLKERKPTK